MARRPSLGRLSWGLQNPLRVVRSPRSDGTAPPRLPSKDRVQPALNTCDHATPAPTAMAAIGGATAARGRCRVVRHTRSACPRSPVTVRGNAQEPVDASARSRPLELAKLRRFGRSPLPAAPAKVWPLCAGGVIRRRRTAMDARSIISDGGGRTCPGVAVATV
jgi:hypothetical protein